MLLFTTSSHFPVNLSMLRQKKSPGLDSMSSSKPSILRHYLTVHHAKRLKAIERDETLTVPSLESMKDGTADPIRVLETWLWSHWRVTEPSTMGEEGSIYSCDHNLSAPPILWSFDVEFDSIALNRTQTVDRCVIGP